MGPCTANARRPTVDSRCRGTTISCCVADLRRCLPTTSVTGVQQSTRYCGALPRRHLCMMTPSSYVTRFATWSQCKSSCKQRWQRGRFDFDRRSRTVCFLVSYLAGSVISSSRRAQKCGPRNDEDASQIGLQCD